MGITLIHFIERFSLNNLPKETSNFLIFTDKVIWDSVFFAFSGKAYCIFALLFGFSFFIQDNSQKEKGNDFRGRFAWRLVLLFFIACINSALFPGEILILYALLGYVLIAVCRLSTRTVTFIAVLLLLQPLEWGQLIYALINPEYSMNAQFDAPYWEMVNAAQKEGSFRIYGLMTILYLHTCITVCFLIGIGVFFLQYFFCCWWLRSHRQGPLEWLWKKATWIKLGKG